MQNQAKNPLKLEKKKIVMNKKVSPLTEVRFEQVPKEKYGHSYATA